MENLEKTDNGLEKKSENTHRNLYKYNSLYDNQHKRREEQLENVKRRRNDQIDEVRGIKEVFVDLETDEPEEEPVDSLHRCHRKHYIPYGCRLMLSEWLCDVPEDLEQRWLFKICPVGVRVVVVAHKQTTTVYSRRTRKQMAKFLSNLPGGDGKSNYSTFTLLDCIYRGDTYYILDVLAWNSYSVAKAPTEFRFFFLKSKLMENPDLSELSTEGVRFVHVDYHEALRPTIEAQFSSEQYTMDDMELPIDGVLFYHKECIYISGRTPLVGWLKPYMIPEQLQVPVDQSYMAKAPKRYTNITDFFKYVTKKKTRKSDRDDMETDGESSQVDDTTDAMDQ